MSALLSPSSLLSASPRPSGARGGYFVQTWGCQMNEEDSEQMGLFLQGMGYEPAPSLREADVILLNTCSVRQKPEDKAFSMLGEIAILKRSRPEIIVGVCGCMAQLRAEEIRKRAPHVDFVIGTGHIAEIPALVQEALEGRRFATRLELPERRGAVVELMPRREVGRAAKLKAFVPIQYGCDKFCTFCIVPTTRGRERSRPTAEILTEVAALARNGTREITLLGQTVNSYGKNMIEGKVPFSELLRLVAAVPGIARVRATSPYPRDFRPDVIQMIRDVPQVMEQCHMPLQSGADSMLRRMRRLYSRESFGEIVASLRRQVPGIGLTTDLIVGFPGETEEEYEATLEAVREYRFDGAYCFAYSPRPGTPAAEYGEQIDPTVKNERLRRLIALQESITQEIHASLVGQVFEVLVEGPSAKNPGRMQGFTREGRMMHFEASPDRVGRLTTVRAVAAHRWGLSGELV